MPKEPELMNILCNKLLELYPQSGARIIQHSDGACIMLHNFCNVEVTHDSRGEFIVSRLFPRREPVTFNIADPDCFTKMAEIVSKNLDYIVDGV